jgi:TnpA family transposase
VRSAYPPARGAAGPGRRGAEDRVKRSWTTDELVEHWTLLPTERALVDDGRAEHTRLGFALLLKWFVLEGRFPRHRHEIPVSAIAHVAQQLEVPASALGAYDWTGRSIKHHRAAIRALLGVREATVQDAHDLAAWLCAAVLPHVRQAERLAVAVTERCRALRIEPPTPERVQRLIRSATATYDERFCATILAQLTPEIRARLDALLDTSHLGVPEAPTAEVSDATEAGWGGPSRSALAELKRDPGPLSLETVRAEVAKLETIRRLHLPSTLFHGVSPKLLDGYRQRVVAEDVRELRRHPLAVRSTLLAAFCWVRSQELTDTLAELLMNVIHHIGAKAERRVEQAFIQDLKRVSGKTNLLFQLAEAAVEHPDGIVREVLYPVVGEQTLRDLVREYRATGPAYQQKVYTVMRASYRAHYRRMVPLLLQALAFHSNNAVHRPVLEAVELLKRYADAPRSPASFAPTDVVPLEGVIRPGWREAVVKRDKDGQVQVNRINYELSVLQAVREKLRCKEMWVAGANRLRNPDEDLPADFAEQRETYIAALGQPLEAEAFVAGLHQRMTTALETLDGDLPTNPFVQLLEKGGGWIALSPLPAQPEPVQLGHLKAELGRRWPSVGLLDMLKETDLRVHFTDHFTSATPREHLDRARLQKRLLLCLYGLGTNMGLKRVSAGDHGESYRDLLYTRRRFITRDQLRAAIAAVANAILRARLPHIWGEGTTACASDSKKFGAWDQNLLTEWHIRYRGPGVMVYWHMDRKAACIYSQLKSCSSSEVAAMITGVLRHCTEMTIDRQFVDSHGQSEVAFTFCHLLGFHLLPRLKGLHRQKLYRPEAGRPEAYPNLHPVLTRPIRWDLIRQQYDEIIKYVTALRLGTADPEDILRRFTRGGVQHPTYQAITEVGKVYKTLFLCEYLRLPALRREIHEGLNVVENWNSANGFIHYGKGGEFATNQRDDQELAMLSLHLLQIALVFVNTLLIQRLLGEARWAGALAPEDLRALSPLIYSHVNPYGLIRLDMDQRLPIEEVA